MSLTTLAVILLLRVTLISSKVYDKCELVRELQTRDGNLFSDSDTWMCIIGRESSYNTNAYNPNGDHGLFQINEQYWCDPQNGKWTKNVCQIPCSNLRDDDLSDDISCVRKIFSIHGFKAWAVYKSCQKQNPFARNAFSNQCSSGLIHNGLRNEVMTNKQNHFWPFNQNSFGLQSNPYSNPFYLTNGFNTIDNNLLYVFA